MGDSTALAGSIIAVAGLELHGLGVRKVAPRWTELRGESIAVVGLLSISDAQPGSARFSTRTHELGGRRRRGEEESD